MILKDALFYVSIILTMIAIFTLLVDPKHGILVTILFKPIIETTWDQVFIGLKLGYIIGVGIPIIIFFHALVSPKDEGLSKTPLIGFWTAYILINFFSCQMVIYNELQRGLDLFFKIFNGFIGFYWFQRYFRDEADLRILLKTMLIAGIFPISIGVFQWLTGYTWKAWTAEGGMRNIGLYHDQAALKYFVFQTITAIILYWCYFKKQSMLILCILATYFLLCLPVLLKLYVKSGNIVLAIWVLGFCMFKRNYILLASGAVIIGVLFFVFQEQILVDVSSVYRQELGYFEGKVELEQTFAGRWHGWKSTMEKWFSADLIEQMFGFGRYADSYGAHNDFLFALARSGFVGLTAYILLLSAAGISVLISLCKDGSALSFMSLMLFIMWMVETIGLVPSAYPSFQWFAWGFIGLSLRIAKIKEDRQLSIHSTASPHIFTHS